MTQPKRQQQPRSRMVEPLLPVGGYRRAIPRDLLTGAPLSPDALILRIPTDLPTQAAMRQERRRRAELIAAVKRPIATPLPILNLDAAEEDDDDETAESAGDVE